MPNAHRWKTTLFWVALAVLTFGAGYVIYYTTAVAPWAFSDSTVYLAAGVNWIKGHGMGFFQAEGSFARLLHFPPGYPVLVGLTTLLLPDPIDAARWINILSFSLLIFFGGLLLKKLTRSDLLPLLFGILLVFCPFLVTHFSGVMSEAPSILCGTLSLLLIALFFIEEKNWQLILAGLLSAAVIFIRYQQAAVLLAGGVFLLFIGRKPWRRRIKHTLLYALLSGAPFALWYLLESFASPGSGARAFGLNGALGEVSKRFLADVYNTIKYWFPWRSGLLPGVDASIIRALILFLFFSFIGFAWLHARKHSGSSIDNGTRPLVLLSALYIAADLVFLLAAMLFANPPPDIGNRMLAPLLPMLFLLILGLEHLASGAFHRKGWGWLVMGVTVGLFCLVFAVQVKSYVVEMHGYGEGYTSLTFKDSPFVAEIRALSGERAIVTNSPALVQFFTLREPFRTFDAPDDPAIASTIRFGDAGTPAQTAFREKCAALVLFDPGRISSLDHESELYFPPAAYGVTNGLVTVFSDPLGTIYLYPGCEGW